MTLDEGFGSARDALVAACAVCVLAHGAAAAASTADARPTLPPRLELRIVVDGGEVVVDPVDCGDVEHREDGSLRLRGRHEVDGFVRIVWDATVGFGPFVFATYTVTNTSPNPSLYTLTATLPIGAPIALGQASGSGCATVVAGGAGGGIGVLPGDTFVYGAIDGEVLPETTGLLPPAFEIDAGPFETHTVGPVSFGLAGAPIPVADVDESIGVTMGFSLPVGATVNVGAWMRIEPVDDAASPEPDGMQPAAVSAAATKEVG